MSTIIALPIINGLATSIKADEKYHDEFSRAAVVSDLDSGRIIYSKNADKKYAMASMTKIMTLFLAFDAIKSGKVKPSDVVEIKSSDVNREGTNIKLNAGDKVTLDVLMKGMMIVSANDAALAISRYVASSTEKFVDEMNKKANEIGMNDTLFFNPNGLPHKIDKDGKSTENTTTANDVILLSKKIFEAYPKELIEITSMKRFEYKPKNIDEENTNPLLPIFSNVDGIKTGFTDKAGYCLSYTMKIDKNKENEIDNRIFGVTMGASSKENREKAAKSILDFINMNFVTKIMYEKDSIVKRVHVNRVNFFDIALKNHDEISVIKKKGEVFTPKFVYNKLEIWDMFSKPIAKIEYYNQDKLKVSEADLYIQPISEMDTLQKIGLALSILKESILNMFSNVEGYPIVYIDIIGVVQNIKDTIYSKITNNDSVKIIKKYINGYR